MILSVNPAKRVEPSADQARHVQEGILPFSDSSGRRVSTTTLDSRSQILTESSVAAQSQYRFGEKTSPLMIAPASREYKRLPSFKSHNMAVLSFPPLAAKEPSGDTQTVLRYPVCPTRSLRSLQLVKFQTLTKRSHPAETMRGTDCEGENLTHETHSVCPSESPEMVYLHSPRVFQRRMVESREPVERKKKVRIYRFRTKLDIFIVQYAPKSVWLTRNDLTVVNRKGHRENILLVSNEPTGGFARGDIPESQLGIPTSGKSKGTIRGDDDIRYKVGVSAKTSTGIAIGIIVTAGGGVGKLPHNDGLIARRRQKKVGVFRGSGETSHPVPMALKGSSQTQILGYGRHLDVQSIAGSVVGIALAYFHLKLGLPPIALLKCTGTGRYATGSQLNIYPARYCSRVVGL